MCLPGDVTLNQPLDYETLISKVENIMVAADSATGQTSSANLQINIMDANDNPPVFDQSVSDQTMSNINI